MQKAETHSDLADALHHEDENRRRAAALSLWRGSDRAAVEDDLLAALADDNPIVRHRALCALGIEGQEARQVRPDAIHLSPLFGTVISPRAFDALAAALREENAPWVAADIVKAVAEQDYSGPAAPLRDRALALLTEAAESRFAEVADEAVAGLRRLTPMAQ